MLTRPRPQPGEDQARSQSTRAADLSVRGVAATRDHPVPDALPMFCGTRQDGERMAKGWVFDPSFCKKGWLPSKKTRYSYIFVPWGLLFANEDRA